MPSITSRRVAFVAAVAVLCVASHEAGSQTKVQSRDVYFKAATSNSVQRTDQDKNRDLFSVKDVGAKGDASTDDRTAFANASASGLEIIVPAGTYRIASNVTLTGTWRFAAGAALRPASGVTITFGGAAMIYADALPIIDTSLGGGVAYQAGASIDAVQPGTTSKTDNFVRGYAGNAIAPDVSISVIAGGGNVGSENYIGYAEALDRRTGDGATTSWTTTYDAAPASILVNLVRADKVRVTISSGQFSAAVSGTKVLVTYPLAGHFVNDGAGGSEGANAALTTSEQLYISSNVKTLVVGSGSDYSAIYGGYDDVVSTGIRQSIEGAHHRITSPDHNTIFGGSYGRISAGNYGFIGGGSANEIGCTGSGSTISGFGNTCTGTGPAVVLGSTNTVSGSFAAALGGTGNVVSGNGAAVSGRSNTASGQDSMTAGNTNTASGAYDAIFGFTNSAGVAGYALVAGRQNVANGAATLAVGRGNTVGGDYSRVSGKDASAPLAFADVVGGEQIAALGDVQTSTIVARRQTTTATATELRLGAATARLTIPSNTTWTFNILVSARQTGAATASAGWSAQGVLRNDAGTAALVAAVTPVVLARDASAAAWTITVTADNTNKALSITATGEAAKTINWVARIELVEVAG